MLPVRYSELSLSLSLSLLTFALNTPWNTHNMVQLSSSSLFFSSAAATVSRTGFFSFGIQKKFFQVKKKTQTQQVNVLFDIGSGCFCLLLPFSKNSSLFHGQLRVYIVLWKFYCVIFECVKFKCVKFKCKNYYLMDEHCNIRTLATI